MTRPYPNYKDSGIESVGVIPANWSATPVKHVASCNDEVLPEDTDPGQEINYVEISGVDPSLGIVDSTRVSFSSAPSRARRKVRDGDILVSTVRTYLRAIARVSYPPNNMIASTGFAVVRPRRADSGFLGYLFTAEFIIGEIISRSVGVSYPAVNANDIMDLKIPLPSVQEQQAIAAFLDRETGKIDALVEEQRRLIALLKEKRQAVISHAVTKGLDPDAPMKPSGIDWLGNIPEHWEVAPLKRFGTLEAGAGFPVDEQGLKEEELPFFKVNAIGKALRDDRLVLDGVDTISRETAKSLRAYEFPSETIVFAKIGAALLLGRVRLLPSTSCIDNNMIGVMVSYPNVAEFFRYLLGLLRFDLLANPGAVPSLNERQIANEHFAVPGPGEQAEIALWIEAQTSKLDALIAEAETAIDLLQERRSALISAAVTGKIDVRDEAAEEQREQSLEAIEERVGT